MCFVITILPIAHNTHQLLLFLVLASHLSRGSLVIHHLSFFFFVLSLQKTKNSLCIRAGAALPHYIPPPDLKACQ